MGLITTKPLKEGKTNEQWKYIEKYFFSMGGCLKPSMTDDEYFADVQKRKNSLNLKQRALNKLGIDESDVQEVAPVEFAGFNFSGDYMAKSWCSSKYETTWLFFGDNQIYMYNYIFDMTSNYKQERTEEYFYKDVTNFSSTLESVEIRIPPKYGCLGQKSALGSLDTSQFSIVVPGDKFTC